jgi:hypothetical protein
LPGLARKEIERDILEHSTTQAMTKEPATRLACGRMYYSRPGPTLVSHSRLSPVKVSMEGSRRGFLLELEIFWVT